MKTTHQTTVYPQTVEIPEPLEVHPSVDPELAAIMLGVSDMIARAPQCFNGRISTITHDGCGCIIALAMGRPMLSSAWMAKFPKSEAVLHQINGEAIGKDAAWAIARIEEFLSTGQ